MNNIFNIRNKNNKFIIIFMFLIILVSVGYAMLTSNLKIQGSADINKASWNIHFDNIQIKDGSVTAINPATLNLKKTTLTYSVNLDKPGDYYIFNVDVVNSGSIDAMVSLVQTLGLTEDQQKYIDYYVTYLNDVQVQVKDLLEAQTKQTLKVVVKYKDNINKEDLPSEEIILNLIFDVTYIQADNTAQNVPKDHPNQDECVAKIKDKTYLTLEDALSSAVDNDTIIMLKDTTESIINKKKVNIDLNGHTISGLNDTTITNKNNLTIFGEGTIENKTGVVINNIGTLTIGLNDDNVTIETIKIKGTTSGIIQNGTFNLYDGVVIAKVAVAGPVTDKPVNSMVYVEHISSNDYQKLYLVDNQNSDSVVILNGTRYVSVQDAINTAELSSQNSTIYFLRNCELPYSLTINDKKTIELDLAGHTVETGYKITNNGTLNIIDTSQEKGILKPSVSITNNNILNINGVSIQQTTADSVVINNKNLNITSSTLTALDGYAVYNTGTQIFISSDSTLTSNKISFYNNSKEEVAINSGNIEGILNDGILKIEDGNITSSNSSNCTINTTTKGSFKLTGGTIIANRSNETALCIYSSNSVIEGGSITSNYEGIRVEGINTIISGGEITATNRGITAYKDTIINGGKIISNNTGIYISSGKTIINNIELEAEQTGIINSSVLEVNGGNINGNQKYGIQNILKANIQGGKITGATYGIFSQSTLNIGNNDGSVQKDIPEIIGTSYGVYFTNTANFYDGVLKGQVSGYNQAFTQLEDGYIVKEDTEIIENKEYKIATLYIQEKFARVGEKTYNSLSKAIADINTEGTIEIIKDANIKSETIIPRDKKITIELAGKNLDFTSTITNEGILILSDNAEDQKGTINFNATGTSIISNGEKLIIDGPTIKNTNSSSNMITINYNQFTLKSGNLLCEHGTVININNNNSQFIMNDGYIKGNNGINNGGIAIINDGIIESSQRGIYNRGTTTINNINIIAQIGVYSNGILNLIDGKIKGTNYGIYIDSRSNVILGGKIESNNIGIYVTSSAILELGEIDTPIDSISITTPEIVGNNYGISTMGTVKFYDGIIKGQKTASNGVITELAEGCTITGSIEIINQEEYKVEYLIKQADYIRVNNKTYNSFTKAIDSIESTGIIEIISDATSKSDIKIPSGKDITIDLNGYNITTSTQIINEGTLTIQDSSEEENGNLILDTNNYGIYSKGISLTINSGTIKYQTGTSNCIYVELGELNTNGGKIIVNTSTMAAIRILKNAKINNIDIESAGMAIESNQNTIIKNCNIVSKKSYAIHVNAGEMIIENGTIVAQETGIRNRAKLNIENINITSQKYGIIANINTINLKGGTIVGKTYGILAEGGTINIGEKDGIINTDNILIMGETYGINITSSHVNFYDGIIKGQTDSYNKEFENIEDNSEPNKYTEVINGITYTNVSLVQQKNIVKNNSIEYKNLQTAIDEAQSNDTIILINNPNIYYDITIPEGKIINIDLAGYTLNTARKIINNGELNIDDETREGNIIETGNYNLITNNSKLHLKNINLINNKTNNRIVMLNSNSESLLEEINIESYSGIEIKSKAIASLINSNITATNDSYITCQGKIAINSGTYKNTSSNNGLYYNSSDSPLEINNVDIQSQRTALYTTTNQPVYINDSIINGIINNNNQSKFTINHSTIQSGYIYNNATEEMYIKNNSSISNTDNSVLVNSNRSSISTITDSTLTSNITTSTQEAIRNTNTGTINIINSTIKQNINARNNNIISTINNINGNINITDSSISLISTEQLGEGRVIVNQNAGTIIITNSNINIKGRNVSTGMYSNATTGEIKLISGNVSVTESKTAYGAFINNGTITLGEKNQSVSTIQPNILAVGTTGIGVKKINGYLKFYDGIIKGSTQAKPETTTEVEYQYEVHNFTDENGYEYCILELMKN